MPGVAAWRVVPTLCLAALALAGCQANSGVCHLYQVDVLPLTLSHGKLLTPVAIEGQPLMLIVDTGAFATTISSKAAERIGLGIKSTYNTGATGVGGRLHFDPAAARRIDVGSLHVTNGGVAVADLAREDTDPPADGYLGMDILRRFDLDFDLVGRKAAFYQAEGACSHQTPPMDGPLYSASLLPHERGQLFPQVTVTIDGQDFKALIDTGADTTVLFKQALDRLPSLRSPGAQRILHGIGPEQVHATTAVLKSVGIGDLEIQNLPVTLAPDERFEAGDMVLGYDLMRRVHLWVSQSSQTLIMQAPPQATHQVAKAAS